MVRRRSLIAGVLGAFVAPTAVLANTKPIIRGRGLTSSIFFIDESPFLPKSKTNSLSGKSIPNKNNVKSTDIYGFDYLINVLDRYKASIVLHG